MDPELLKTVFLPLALIIIMFGMGMTLVPADFVRVVKAPAAKLLGLANQLVLLPLVAFLLVVAFDLPGALAVGLVLIAACPGGPTSNIIAHLSKGDTALSVTLTAVSSLVTVFTIPLIVGLGMDRFLGAEEAIELPFLKTVLQLVIVTILPISLGMAFRAWKPGWAQRGTRPVNTLSILFLALIILAAVLQEDNLGEQFRQAGPAAVALNFLTMGLGFGTALLFGLPLRQRITLSIECGIQNGTLALAIALGILENATIAIPAVVYSLLMFFSGGAMILIFGRRRAA
jgi:BASS family bile acid:Na+ symporter